MSDITILREKKPEVAEFVSQWRTKYQRTFQTDSPMEQANFYEAMVEMARHIAGASASASVSLTVSNNGVDGLRISVCPKG